MSLGVLDYPGYEAFGGALGSFESCYYGCTAVTGAAPICLVHCRLAYSSPDDGLTDEQRTAIARANAAVAAAAATGVAQQADAAAKEAARAVAAGQAAAAAAAQKKSGGSAGTRYVAPVTPGSALTPYAPPEPQGMSMTAKIGIAGAAVAVLGIAYLALSGKN